MSKKPNLELTEGSEYKITSLGGRDILFETEGVFKGFVSLYVDEVGLIMEMNKKHGDMAGKIRIIPIHVVLAIDVLEAKLNQKKLDDKEMSHYVG